MEVKFVEGLRVSDAETVEVAKMVLLGKINSDILTRLNRHGQPAVGPRRRGRVAVRGQAGRAQSADVGFVGEIEQRQRRRDRPHRRGLRPGDRLGRHRPRRAPPTTSTPTRRPARWRRRCRAHKAIFLTDVDGWLRDPDDPGSRISQATADEVRAALDGVGGGMRPKLTACVDAIAGGVEAAHIVDGRRPHSLLLELFTDAGIGTKITPHEARRAPGARVPVGHADLSAHARRVRARRGRAALGLGRQRVPRLPGRDLGLLGRALPPGGGRGGPRAGRDASPTPPTST